MRYSAAMMIHWFPCVDNGNSPSKSIPFFWNGTVGGVISCWIPASFVGGFCAVGIHGTISCNDGQFWASSTFREFWPVSHCSQSVQLSGHHCVFKRYFQGDLWESPEAVPNCWPQIYFCRAHPAKRRRLVATGQKHECVHCHDLPCAQSLERVPSHYAEVLPCPGH